MSKVYHGSVEEVRNPEIRQSNRSLDYGSGFYTTTSYEQAKKWVERRMKDKGESIGYVNVYELDDEVMEDMKSLFFEPFIKGWRCSRRTSYLHFTGSRIFQFLSFATFGHSGAMKFILHDLLLIHFTPFLHQTHQTIKGIRLIKINVRQY